MSHLSLLEQSIVELLVRNSVHGPLRRASLQIVHGHTVYIFLHFAQNLSLFVQNVLLLFSHNGVRCFQRLLKLSFRSLGFQHALLLVANEHVPLRAVQYPARLENDALLE